MNKLCLKKMKLTWLVVFSGLIANTSFSQGVIFDPSDRASKVLDILSISSSEYIFASKSDFSSGAKIIWYRNDSIIKMHILNQNISGLDLELTEEGVLVEASSFFQCDVIVPFFHTFLLDTITSEESYLPTASQLDEDFAQITRTSEEDLILITGDAISNIGEILKVYREDDLVLEYKLPSEKINKITEGQDRIYVYGGEYLLYFNKIGLVVDSIFLEGETVVDVTEMIDHDQIAVLTDARVLTINFLTGIDRSYDLPGLAARPIDLLFSDELYLLLVFLDEDKEVQTLDFQGNWQTHYHLKFDKAEYTEMYPMPNNEIWITGRYYHDFTNNTGGSDYRYEGAYVIEKTLQTEDAENDLGLEFLGYESISDNEVKVDLRLTNHSDSQLKDIKVLSNNLSLVWCNERYFDAYVDSIAAGESLEVSDTIKLFSNLREDDYCFYVLGSGQNVDSDFGDNVTCALLVNTQDQLEKKNDLIIYPNPAVDELVIENSDTTVKYFILNLQGQLIKVVKTGSSNTIKLGDLVPGIYLLKDSTTGNTQKFVKI